MCVHGYLRLWQIEGDFKAISWRHLFSGSLNSNGRENESKANPSGGLESSYVGLGILVRDFLSIALALHFP